MLKIKIIFILLLSLNFFAHSEIYSSHENTEVFFIDKPAEDEDVRLNILARAKHSIQIVSHIQDASLFGSKVTEVLRDRMSNGVSLTYIYEKVATVIGGDSSDKSVNLLRDSSFYDGVKSRIYINRPFERLKTPFSIHDLFHEKIIIVDGGTPNEIIIIGGRNHDMHGIEFSDLSFVIRRVQNGKPYLGDSLKEHYNKILKIVDKHFNVETPRIIKPKELTTHQATLAAGNYAQETEKTQTIKSILSRPPILSETLMPYQFRPNWGRLVTNDLFDKIIDLKLKKKLLIREELLSNDITAYIGGLIGGAKKVISSTYVVAFPPDIANGYASMLANGGEGIIYTNSPEAYAGKSPIRFFGITYGALNYESLIKFQKVSVAPDGNVPWSPVLSRGVNPEPIAQQANEEVLSRDVNMMMLDPIRGKEMAGVVLNHKKVILMDFPNGNKLVSTGSDNFNLNSAAKNSELLVTFNDSRMQEYIATQLKSEGEAYYAKVDLSKAKEIVKKSKHSLNMCRAFFLSLF